MIMGVVTREGRVQPRISVKFTWRWMALRMGRLSQMGLPNAGTVTDDNGFFVACGVPIDVALDLEARSGDLVFRDRVRMERARFLRHDVQLGTSLFEDAVTQRRH